MPFVKSRVNGLMVAIPNDARNVIHRFAVHGGGNELVFEPLTRKDYDASKRRESQPLGLGSSSPGEADEPITSRPEAVTLSIGVVEDDGSADEGDGLVAAPAAPVAPKRTRAKRPTAAEKAAAEKAAAEKAAAEKAAADDDVIL